MPLTIGRVHILASYPPGYEIGCRGARFFEEHFGRTAMVHLGVVPDPETHLKEGEAIARILERNRILKEVDIVPQEVFSALKIAGEYKSEIAVQYSTLADAKDALRIAVSRGVHGIYLYVYGTRLE